MSAVVSSVVLHKVGKSEVKLNDLLTSDSPNFVWIVYDYYASQFEGYGKAIGKSADTGELWYKFLDHCSCHYLNTELDGSTVREWQRMSNTAISEFFYPTHALEDDANLREAVFKLVSNS